MGSRNDAFFSKLFPCQLWIIPSLSRRRPLIGGGVTEEFSFRMTDCFSAWDPSAWDPSYVYPCYVNKSIFHFIFPAFICNLISFLNAQPFEVRDGLSGYRKWYSGGPFQGKFFLLVEFLRKRAPLSSAFGTWCCYSLWPFVVHSESGLEKAPPPPWGGVVTVWFLKKTQKSLGPKKWKVAPPSPLSLSCGLLWTGGWF